MIHQKLILYPNKRSNIFNKIKGKTSHPESLNKEIHKWLNFQKLRENAIQLLENQVKKQVATR